MKYTSIFIVALLCIQGLTAHETKFNSLVEIDKHPFGQAVMSYIQMNMQDSPIEDLGTLLDEMKAFMDNEQAAADQADTAKQGDCSSQLSDMDSTISSYEAIIQTEQDNLANADQGVSDTEVQISNKEEFLASTQTSLANAIQADADASSAYMQSQSDFADAIKACGEAIALLQGMQISSSTSTTSLVQIQSGMGKVSDILKKHMPASFAAFSPILEILSQIKSKADPKLVQNVIDLIDRLKVAMENEKDTRTAAENVRKANFITTSQDLQSQIDSLNTSYLKLHGDLIDYQNEVIRSSNSIDHFSSLLTDLKAVRDHFNNDCNDAHTAYLTDQANRQSEEALLDQLIAHFDTNIATVSDYMVGRVSSL